MARQLIAILQMKLEEPYIKYILYQLNVSRGKVILWREESKLVTIERFFRISQASIRRYRLLAFSTRPVFHSLTSDIIALLCRQQFAAG